MNRQTTALSANDQLKRLKELFNRSKSEFDFIELCESDMGIKQAEAVLFYKILNPLF